MQDPVAGHSPEHHAPRAEPLLHLGHPDHHIPGYELPETASKPPSGKACVIGFLIAAAVAVGGWRLERLGDGAAIPAVSLAWLLPFVLLLGCIAIMPFAAKHFWEKHYQNVSFGLGLLVALYYVFGLHAGPTMAESFSEYISFIFLLGSLFVVAGGVIIRVRRRATPAANLGLLIIGALLANVLGTTGASMLLIRPFLRMNAGRVGPYHVVFFIFMVANVGGALTPIGDPPLFLGYLRGVPFWWVLTHCWPIWLTAIVCLGVVFFVIDARHFKKAPAEEATPGSPLQPPVSIIGAANLLWLIMILAAVFCPAPLREIMMAFAAFGSLACTSHRIYGENHFNHAPIKEVAFLFVGIFATMVPAMNYLHQHAQDAAFKKHLSTPGQFYFASGTLSSVLDNAPTYVTFLETALGKNSDKAAVIERERSAVAAHRVALSAGDMAGLSAGQVQELRALHETLLKYHLPQIAAGSLPPEEIELGFMLDDSGALSDGNSALFKFLMAISMGAVFFGACTYIGNGPNFMVKSIAAHAGAQTPGFFAYILFYTLPVLLPILILCWLLFLR